MNYSAPALRAAVVLLSLLLGCTARSGGGVGGGFIDPDAGSSDDVASGNDAVTAPDDTSTTGTDSQVQPPIDVVAGDDVVTSPDVPTTPSCGDGMCAKGESCSSCPGDCGPCPERCGDGMCASSESCSSCPGDCGPCPSDCGAASCGDCAARSACGWCRATNACVAREGASCADLVTSASACSTTPTTNITAPCTVPMTTGGNDCGFTYVTNYPCTAGSTLTFGCTGGVDAGSCGFSGGSCMGDPLLRICAGDTRTGCAFAARVLPQNAGLNGVTADDDGCGFCPWVRIACPAQGSVSVFTRAYDIATPALCTVARTM